MSLLSPLNSNDRSIPLTKYFKMMRKGVRCFPVLRYYQGDISHKYLSDHFQFPILYILEVFTYTNTLSNVPTSNRGVSIVFKSFFAVNLLRLNYLFPTFNVIHLCPVIFHLCVRHFCQLWHFYIEILPKNTYGMANLGN